MLCAKLNNRETNDKRQRDKDDVMWNGHETQHECSGAAIRL